MSKSWVWKVFEKPEKCEAGWITHFQCGRSDGKTFSGHMITDTPSTESEQYKTRLEAIMDWGLRFKDA